MEEQTPTATNAPLVLQAPTPVATVTPDQALGAVPLTADDKAKLDGQVDDFTQSLMTLDVHGDGFRAKVDSIANLADVDIQASASVTSRLLDRPTRAMNDGPLGAGSSVSQGLTSLRRQIEALDPSKQGDLFGVKRFLGLIPMGSKIVDYFHSYESSQTQLNKILDSLYSGKDELQRDVASIDQEKQNMWDLMGRLEKYAYLAAQIDASLSAKIDAVTDSQRKKILQEEALFGLRQKRQDIATQMAVNVQGYMALDLIRRNDIELVKGVDRATTTTVSALRTAIIVAQALASQKLVLNQIDALNTTTSNMISATSVLLKDQSTRVAEQAMSSGVSVETLQKSFDNIFQALDTVDNYKIAALQSMRQTVETLDATVAKAKPYLDRERAKIASSETL